MKYAITKGDILQTAPAEVTREPRSGEKRVKCIYSRKDTNPIMQHFQGYKLESIAGNKAYLSGSYKETNLEESKEEATKLLSSKSQEVREAGFISVVTGLWTGALTKDAIIRASIVANSARNAVTGGRPTGVRNYKVAGSNTFIQLTNKDISDLDDEINGDTGFIQQCYDREEEISTLVDGVLTDAQAVSDLYYSVIDAGWPDHVTA